MEKERNIDIGVSRTKRKILRHVWPIRILILALVIVFLTGFGSLVATFSKSIGIANIVTFAESFIFPSSDALQTDFERVNILVLGIGGKGHEGSLLTDTMLLASIPLSPKSIEIVSIPRDIWIPDIRAKINSAYYWGSQRDIGGLGLSKSVTSEVLGVKPAYGVVIDFSGFKKIVDALGGITVNVKTGFTDNSYPITGMENDLCGGDKTLRCRYEKLTFNPGMQKMDGETALKFVRSRHAEGDEGTDTARQTRQQLVIDAMRNKLVSNEILLNPKKITEVWSAIRSSVESDMDINTLAVIARKSFDSRKTIVNNLIPEEMLTNPPISQIYDKQYVFVPSKGNGNWQEIHEWVKGILD